MTEGIEDVALTAGAAIGALDAVVRRQERWAGAWRQRLALAAAAATSRAAGRIEDEAALRDAVLLTRPGDDVGPAGRMLLAWMRLASLPPDMALTQDSIGQMLEEFGHAGNDEAVSGLSEELQNLAAQNGIMAMLTQIFLAAERRGFAPSAGCWLADAMLAQRLGWLHGVPLLGGEAPLSGGRRTSQRSLAVTDLQMGSEHSSRVIAALARAALRAVDLSCALERRASRLLAVAPRLRAKSACVVVERLLAADAVVASQKIAGISERGMRRLFDRLIELGAVRELSGRPSFRIHGL